MPPLPHMPSQHAQGLYLFRHIYMQQTTFSFVMSVCADTSDYSHQKDIHKISHSGILLQFGNIFLTYIYMHYKMLMTHL